jgi:hypothetical protein
MKRIILVALAAVVCLAVLAGKDDIRQIRRMHSM